MKYGDGFNAQLAEPDIEAFTGEDISNVRWARGKIVWDNPPIIESAGGITLPAITGVPAVDIPALILAVYGSIQSIVVGGKRIEQKRRKRKATKAAEAKPQ
jgi:hypothetical protein